MFSCALRYHVKCWVTGVLHTFLPQEIMDCVSHTHIRSLLYCVDQMSDRVRRYPSTRLLDLKDVGAQTPTLLPGCSGAHPVAGMHQGSVGEDGTDRQGLKAYTLKSK